MSAWVAIGLETIITLKKGGGVGAIVRPILGEVSLFVFRRNFTARY